MEEVSVPLQSEAERYLSTLNDARATYESALRCDFLCIDRGQRWVTLQSMDQAQRAALTWLTQHGHVVEYCLRRNRYVFIENKACDDN